MGRLVNSALAHIAKSTLDAYVGTWNAFILWYGSLLRPRRLLMADDLSVALYLQSLTDSEKIYSNFKSVMYILLRRLFPFCGYNDRLVHKNHSE